MHIKIKHNGGTKTDRDKYARQLLTAHCNGVINMELDKVDLNLPPGLLQKVVERSGLNTQINEGDVMKKL